MTSNNVTRRANWESLLVPIVLVLAGALILLAANVGFVSLDRTKDLWPVSIALVGLAELFADGAGKDGKQDD